SRSPLRLRAFPPRRSSDLKGIPVLVKNTFAPDDAGTLIEAESASRGDIIRGITSIDRIAVLNLEGSGMVGVPGFSKRLFDALSRSEEHTSELQSRATLVCR